MPTETIKFKVESNIFNDASKVKTAHSYNVTLPRTMTNDNVLAMAYVAAKETGGISTHRYLKASLHLDGVALFADGYAVLTSVSDKGYNITLLWGLLNIFDTVKDENLNLCDIVTSKMVSGDLGIWMKPAETHLNYYVSGMDSGVYSVLDDDSKALADRLPWCLLPVTANNVLDTINAVYSLPLSISATAQERIDKLVHPLTSLNCLAKGEVCVINLRTAWEQSQPGNNNWYCGIMDSGYTGNPIDFYSLTPLQYNNPPSAFHSATNKWQANNALQPWLPTQVLSNSKITVEKVRVFGTNPSIASFSVTVNGETASSTAVGGMQKIDHTFDDEFAVEKNKVFLTFTCSTSSAVQATSNINIQIWLKGIDISDGCHMDNGDWWSVVRNYPSMGVITYLNELMAHIGGCFVGSVTDASSLRIMTLDEIAADYAKAVDALGVNTITMALADLAQKNIYTHQENEDNGVNYQGEGAVYVADSTLAAERTAHDSKFRVPMNVMVRLWEIEKNENASNYKAKWVGGKDYICGWDSDAGVCRNTGQDFTATIASYYINYKRIVEQPKAVDVVVRMTVLELLRFDLSKPIHINQLGRNYLVESIESDVAEQYKLKLIQI